MHELSIASAIVAEVRDAMVANDVESVSEVTVKIGRLSGIVADSLAKHVMVFVHHPPVPMGSRWLDSVGLENGEEFLERLHTFERVRVLAFGHVHQDYDEDHDGIRILATPSTCRQFRPGSNKFDVDDKPPAYRRIELNADGTVGAELIWVEP